MEANELMVGDWVMLTDPINNGERVQVKEIHGDGCITVDGAITKMFEPITLTAEILEKNGFEYYNDTAWVLANGFILVCEFDCMRYNDKIKIKYVHELQHILRLTNFEKEIEL